jgi:hypothetical protein
MNDMRNVAAHEYLQIDIETLWETIQHDLPFEPCNVTSACIGGGTVTPNSIRAIAANSVTQVVDRCRAIMPPVTANVNASKVSDDKKYQT